MHTEKLKAHRKNEDPRLSFTTPEFKEASRVFTEAYKVRSVVFAYAPKGLHAQSYAWRPPQLLRAYGMGREQSSHPPRLRKTSTSPSSGSWPSATRGKPPSS